MQTQEIIPLLDKLSQPRRMYRINTGNGRLYWTKDETTGQVKTFVSATTFVRSVSPTPSHLIDWRIAQGNNYERNLDLAANYGTLMHYLNAELLIHGTYDLDKIEKAIEPFALENNFKHWKQDWADELKSDMLAFAKFVQDYEVDPLAIEMVLGSDKYGVAGALDIICYLTIEVDGFSETEKFKTGARAGEFKPEKKKKRVLAIVDMKSGRKGFHSDHALQLAIHKQAFRESFPQFNDQEIYLFNWAPTEWRTEPNYKLKDQTNEIDLQLLPHYAEIARITELKKDRNMKLFTGVVDLKRPDKLKENITYQTLTKYLEQL